MRTIDEAAAVLHKLGYSSGDISYTHHSVRTWLVFCRKDGDEIKAEAPSQREAWEKAAQVAVSRVN